MFNSREPRLKKLLIVEDEPLIAFDNEYFLGSHGYEVVGTIDNARDAEAIIAKGGIDLVLADVRLSGESSGRDVALAARAAGVPVLFVTASCPVDAPQIAVGCLAKPYSQADLKLAIEAVAAHMGGGKTRRSPKGLTLYS